MKKQFLQSAKVIILGLILTVGASYAMATWTNPLSTAPSGNVYVPINVNPAGQFKLGGLAIVTGNFSVGFLGPSIFKVSQGSPNKITIGDAPGGNGTTKISLFGAGLYNSNPTAKRLCINSAAQVVLCL